jgi:peptide chain release factor 1
VHSSTITVAVMTNTQSKTIYDQRSDDDFVVEWFSGSGAGGQHRNKHANSARIIHLPTGIVRCAQTRSRENSRQNAMQALHSELDRLGGSQVLAAENAVRRADIGSGERSDKSRTVRFQDDQVIDHVTGRRMTARAYMAGKIDQLWG